MGAALAAGADLEATQTGEGSVAVPRERKVGHDLAVQTSGSPRGPFRIGKSPALNIAYKNEFFTILGLPPLTTR